MAKKIKENKKENEVDVHEEYEMNAQTIDLDEAVPMSADEMEPVDENVKKSKYDGYLPLVKNEKEAKKFMRNLLADDAREAGADALFRGVQLKKRYETMRRLAFSLSAVGVVSAAVSSYAVCDKSADKEKYELLLQQATQSMPTNETQFAHQTYAQSIASIMMRHPEKGVYDATKEAVQLLADANIEVSFPMRHIVGKDLVALAQAYENMGAPRNGYFTVLAGYAKGRQGDYTVPQHTQEQIKGKIMDYIRSSSR